MDSSPYIGWTRRTWEDLADRLLASERRYATPGHALINLPGPASRSGERSDGLEGFARTFLLAAFRMSQSDRGDLAEWYDAGLAAGIAVAGALADVRGTRAGQGGSGVDRDRVCTRHGRGCGIG